MLTFLIARSSSSLQTGTKLGFLRHNGPHISYSFSSFGKSSQSNQSEQNQERNQSLTVSYLVNSCGVCAEVASAVSKRIKLEDSDKPNSILNLLRSYGFSDTQISETVSRFPRVLLVEPEHDILPKLRFIQSIGFSASEIPELLSYKPALLLHSLEKRIIPYYEALKSVLDDDWKVRKCLKSSNWGICSFDVTNIVPNVKVLRDEGVPQSSVFYLLYRRANLAFMDQSMFGEYVEFVKETGIKPFEFAFVEALIVVTRVNKSTWEIKLDIFERLGWSRDVTLLAFRKQPKIMGISEEKIIKIMKFLVDEMGLRSEDIASYPTILCYSINQRIIPRWSVLKILKMKGLIKDDISLLNIVIMREKKFLEDFVIKFQESVPHLLKLYRDESRPLPEVQA